MDILDLMVHNGRVPFTDEPQPRAGRIIARERAELGLGAQDFCQLVSRTQTKWGRVSLSRSQLQRIEAGVVPLNPRMYAIASVLDMDRGDIWDLPDARRTTRTRRTV